MIGAGRILRHHGRRRGCFIATAAYGTEFAPEVYLLQDFRDNYLLKNPLGKFFVEIYYFISPPIANIIKESEALKKAVRIGLTPIVRSVSSFMARR